MELLGSNAVNQVGLKLLLSPLSSTIVARTACCSVGIVLPVYSTFKAIERKNEIEQRRWLLYWAVYGSFSLVEVFSDKLLSWVPIYYHLKFGFLVWLQLPTLDGAKKLYVSHLRPFFLRHQAKVDKVVGIAYGEMASLCKEYSEVPFLTLYLSVTSHGKMVSKHEEEIKFARCMFVKMMASVDQTVRGNTSSDQRSSTRRVSDSESDLSLSDEGSDELQLDNTIEAPIKPLSDTDSCDRDA